MMPKMVVQTPLQKDHLDKAIDRHRMQRNEGPAPSDLLQIYLASQSEEGIRGKTILNSAYRNMIYVYDMLDPKYPKAGLKAAATRLAHLLISEGGKSREQGIELFQGFVERMLSQSVSLDATRPAQNPPPK